MGRSHGQTKSPAVNKAKDGAFALEVRPSLHNLFEFSSGVSGEVTQRLPVHF
jgi:hypothetical protein